MTLMVDLHLEGRNRVRAVMAGMAQRALDGDDFMEELVALCMGGMEPLLDLMRCLDDSGVMEEAMVAYVHFCFNRINFEEAA